MVPAGTSSWTWAGVWISELTLHNLPAHGCSSDRAQAPCCVISVSRAPLLAWYPELVSYVLTWPPCCISHFPTHLQVSTPCYSPWHGWSMLWTTCRVALLLVFHDFFLYGYPFVYQTGPMAHQQSKETKSVQSQPTSIPVSLGLVSEQILQILCQVEGLTILPIPGISSLV